MFILQNNLSLEERRRVVYFCCERYVLPILKMVITTDDIFISHSWVLFGFAHANIRSYFTVNMSGWAADRATEASQ